ncbi:mediator of RNA polymerase II transcription subunit 15a-like [Dorcoceras hygrometricum]|uniref:Mediator of RNA polymerase II transcription subunit 15a-like n=1 Tax=Dorcoceras hygrometricum TaxID=472368 RepID=A0A2Z7DG14_9LAMI|nr:mediator of RNA polymerase II transcription subunit 15a-like [Dorcoceras hygrometricum]
MVATIPAGRGECGIAARPHILSLTTVANNLSKLDNQTLLRNTRAGQPVDRTLKSLKGKPSTGPQNGVALTYPNDVAYYQQLDLSSQAVLAVFVETNEEADLTRLRLPCSVRFVLRCDLVFFFCFCVLGSALPIAGVAGNLAGQSGTPASRSPFG